MYNDFLAFQNFQVPNPEDDEEVAMEEAEELGHAETYAEYMPSKCKYI